MAFVPRSCVVAFTLAAAVSAQAQVGDAPTFAPMDVFDLQWAENPVLSPDGKSIVYQRSFFDPMKDVRRSNLWLLDVASGQTRPLTSGARRDGDPVWSPDGKRVAYVASDGERPQIFVQWLDSPTPARVTQLTAAPRGLSWSPDGRQIAFLMHVPAESKPMAKMPAAPKGAEWAKPATVIEEALYRFDGAGYVEPGYTHLFVVPAEGGPARQVTQGTFDIGGRAEWLPDGRGAIVSANRDADADFEPFESELYRVDMASGELTRLTDRKGPDRSPALSPDGRRVAYLGFDDRGMGYHNSRLYVLDLASGERRELTASLDASVDGADWLGNREIAFHYDERGITKLAAVAAAGGKPRMLADDFGGTSMGRPYTGGEMSVAADRVAYTRGTAYRPADVAVVAPGTKPRVLTDLSANLLDNRKLARIEEIEYASSADGRRIQGWIAYPPDFDPNRKYPLLLEIHGGPFAAYGPHFAPEIQLYAAHGYVVLYTNPRGSTSYGDEFANLIHHDYPGKDYDDLMSGVDALVARGFVDEKNLFVTGGSGGGALTTWIVGHTDRFRAAVAAKPVINWYSFVLTADAYPFFARYWFPGLPWDNAEHYLKRSPIHYAGNIKTPTMVLTGESDHRTPISESEQLYQALKLRRVPTALVRIPGASHTINARPSQMLAQVLNTVAWFQRHAADGEKSVN